MSSRKAGKLLSHRSQSCGCGGEQIHTSHGRSRSPEYDVWHAMLQRCHNPNNRRYRDYGARHITVCDSWRLSFAAFFADMGPRPTTKHTIERLNNNQGHTPSNTVWATQAQQSRNMRRNRFITFHGETMCVLDWSHRSGIPNSTLRHRLRKGWSVERALTTPCRKTPAPTPCTSHPTHASFPGHVTAARSLSACISRRTPPLLNLVGATDR